MVRIVYYHTCLSSIHYRVFICVCIRCSEDDHWAEYRWNHLFAVCWFSPRHSSNYCTYCHLHQWYGYFLHTHTHTHSHCYLHQQYVYCYLMYTSTQSNMHDVPLPHTFTRSHTSRFGKSCLLHSLSE